jgi:hypothetical protein
MKLETLPGNDVASDMLVIKNHALISEFQTNSEEF